MNKKYLIYALLHFLICVLIVKFFGKPPFIRGFLGDMFFMGLMYYTLKTFHNFNKNKLMIFLLFLAFGVEICQYYKILDILGINNKFLKILFGATFDLWDLLAYSIGTILIWVEENKSKEKIN